MLFLGDTVRQRTPSLAVWGLLGLNIFMFLFAQSLVLPAQEELIRTLGIVPARYTEGPAAWLDPMNWVSLLTALFLHGGWLHLISNLWTLWVFGHPLESLMGAKRFLAFYLLCGLAASLTHIGLYPGSTEPVIGASGAISGLMGAYCLLFPRAYVFAVIPLLFLPIPVVLPAVTYILAWFGLQFVSGLWAWFNPDHLGLVQIAWWAHIGGFLAGLLLCRLFVLRQRMAHQDDFDIWNVWYADRRSEPWTF